jgi:hypothetical protein
MKVTYTPVGGEPQVWGFEPDDVPQSQAEMIEKRYGGRNWDQFLQDCRQGSARARKVLLWHLLRQVHHTLRLEDVPDFKMGAVKVEHTVAELLVLRDRINKASLDDEEKDGILAALDIEITEAMGDEPAEAEPGKDSTPQT